jgi:hypothetical protein
VHRHKVEALLDHAALPAAVAATWRAWNGPAGTAWAPLPEAAAWHQATVQWRDRLLLQHDLVTQLRAFVDAHEAAVP